MTDSIPKYVHEMLLAEAIKRAQVELEIERREEGMQAVLDANIKRAYPLDKYPDFETSEDAYRATIQRVGNPPDQIANFERYGIALLRWQLEFAKWSREADTPTGPNEIGCGGARGPGKSFLIFCITALDDCQRMPGITVLYLRKAQKSGKQQVQKLITAVLGQVEKVNSKNKLDPTLDRLQYNYVESPTPTITFNNGSKIIVGHFQTEAEALNYQGIEYDIVVIEETTHLSKTAYDKIGLTNRTDNPRWRPRMYNSTNPLGKGHGWYKKYFVDPERYDHIEKQGQTKFIPATVDDNHFVDEDYADKLDNLRGAEKKAWRHGDWDVSAGAYFETFRHDAHVIDKLNDVLFNDLTDIPADWELWMSLDIGFRHWNVFHVHVKDTQGNTYTIKEFAHRMMQPEQIAPDVISYLKSIDVYEKRDIICYAGGDAFRMLPGQPNTVAQKYFSLGIPLVPAWTQPGSRVEGARFISQLLGDPEAKPENNPTLLPSWYIGDNCTRLIDCLATLEPDPHNAEDVLKTDCEADGEGGDDAYDAARYGLYVPHGTQIA